MAQKNKTPQPEAGRYRGAWRQAGVAYQASIAARTVPVNYAEGWLTVGTNGFGAGLPVIGYAATKAAGATNLGGTWMHRTSK